MASIVFATPIMMSTTNYPSKNSAFPPIPNNVFRTPTISINRSKIAAPVAAVAPKFASNTATGTDYYRALTKESKERNGATVGDNKDGDTNPYFSTTCHIFNGSNSEIELLFNHDWHGHIVGDVPWAIQPDSQGEFKHARKQNIPEGSTGAMVYRVRNDGEEEYEWLFAWDNPYDIVTQQPGELRVYTEFLNLDYDASNINWPEIRQKLSNSGPSSTAVDNEKGLVGTVAIRNKIGSTTSANCVATVYYI